MLSAVAMAMPMPGQARQRQRRAAGATQQQQQAGAASNRQEQPAATVPSGPGGVAAAGGCSQWRANSGWRVPVRPPWRGERGTACTRQ